MTIPSATPADPEPLDPVEYEVLALTSLGQAAELVDEIHEHRRQGDVRDGYAIKHKSDQLAHLHVAAATYAALSTASTLRDLSDRWVNLSDLPEALRLELEAAGRNINETVWQTLRNLRP